MLNNITRLAAVLCLLIAGAAQAEDIAADSALPEAITCYQQSANAKDIDAYMACFTEDVEMIDVTRTITGQDAVRAWAQREVIPHGDTFRHRRILERSDAHAKTEVKWLTWVAHYTYWWNEDGKITRMSLQYAD